MKRQTKKLCSILLILTLLIGLLPAIPAAAASITDIELEVMAPEAGRALRYDYAIRSNNVVMDLSDDPYYEGKAQNGIVWFCNDQPLEVGSICEVGKVYTVRVGLLPKNNSDSFSKYPNPDPTITINEQTASIQYNAGSYITAELTFPEITGYTITFNAGSGSGTMASVSGVAGTYQLPACTFTAPHSSQEFKCWKISTDSYDWNPGEKISVYQNITVTAVWKNKSTRQQISNVVATSDDLDSIPILYGRMEIPSFTVTQGAPAYIMASTYNLRWEKKNGSSWDRMEYGRFTAGEWRISTQVRIDGNSGTTHELGDPFSLTVNGKAWTVDGSSMVYNDYSMVWVYSPTFTIVNDPNIQPPIAITEVALSLNGYQSGKPVSEATVTTTAKVTPEILVFFEADSIDALQSEDPNAVQIATGNFSANKVYVVILRFFAKDGYMLDDLKAKNVSMSGVALELDEYLDESKTAFECIYVLNAPQKCTVTFNTNGGSAVSAQKLDYGVKATKPANPTKSGYTFKGWTYKGSVYDFNTAVKDDITLDALWEKKAPSVVQITSINLSLSAEPKVGATPKAATITAINGKSTLKNAVAIDTYWGMYNAQEGVYEPNGTMAFKAGRTYGAAFYMDAGSGYKFAKNCTVVVTTPQGKKKLTIEYSDDQELDCGLIKFAPLPIPFKDVKAGEYYTEPVLWAVENGITNGTSETTFSPDAECTRGQIVTFLWRAAGSPKPKNSKNPFKDVKKGAYYYDAVLWAVEKGITTGTSKTTFSPDAGCTRGQVVTFLWRAKNKPVATGKNTFKDVKKGEYYYDAVLWAVKNNITNGTAPGAFSPNATCTRGQIVTFLYRAYK